MKTIILKKEILNHVFFHKKPLLLLFSLIFLFATSSTAQYTVSSPLCAVTNQSENNAPFEPVCGSATPVKVILILDESLSIGPNTQNETNVEDGVLSFMNALENSPLSYDVAIIEFGYAARQADINGVPGLTFGYLPLTQSLIDNGITDYLKVEPNLVSDTDPTSYNPRGGGTIWSAALGAATTIGNPDLVVFFTDGLPNNCPNLNTAIDAANVLKLGGAKIFGVGVADAIIPANLVNLQAITGLTLWNGTPATFGSSDYAVCANFSNVVADLGAVGSAICSQADLHVSKTAVTPTYTPGGSIEWQVVLTNTGPSNIFGALVNDDIDNNLTNVQWTVTGTTGTSTAASISGTGDIVNEPVNISNGGSITYSITADVPFSYMGNIANMAEITPPAGTMELDNTNNQSSTMIVPACLPSITCPPPATFDCGDDAGILVWLNSATTETCGNVGIVTTNYSSLTFDKCVTTTHLVTFSLAIINPLTGMVTVVDDCRAFLTINAAPPAVVDMSIFPTSLTCEEASAAFDNFPNIYQVSYDNGVLGSCNISDSGITPSSLVWQGIPCAEPTLGLPPGLTIGYSITDECGNDLSFTFGPIPVDPAPPATLTPPTFPANISCTMAPSFSAPNASYTNGLTGSCEISGNITPTITNSWDVCGGIITVSYDGTDQCGRPLTAGPFTINVTPAPAATVIPPTFFPTNISCADAQSFTAVDATYANGLIGTPCDISGVIPAMITNSWDACGGTITINYNTTDVCGRPLTAGPFVINVDPAPEATITPPTFPTSISCEMASTFTAPDAPYTNGLTGSCEISGNLAAGIIPTWNACDGGQIRVAYGGFDVCGRPLSSGLFFINVEPAPVPVVTPPTFPTSISCEMAQSFSAGNATYTNGLMGACEISGTITPVVNSNWDACGGTIEVSYSDTDVCGHPLSGGAFLITVEPAPAPIVILPTFPTSISCEMAQSFSAGNATYTNGLTGVCEISGTITPIINNIWDACGGTIEVIYNSGVDICGNPLTGGVFLITVDPAPAPVVTPPTFPTNISCEMAQSFSAGNATYTNGLMGVCEISGTITPVVNNIWDACGGTIEVSYSGIDACGNPLSGGAFLITVDPAPLPTIATPSLPSLLSCEAAFTYVAPDAIFTNGLSGVCNLLEVVTPTVTNNFTLCGGTLRIEYFGTDDCGRSLSAGPYDIPVSPAPEATVTYPTLPTSLSCAAADVYTAPDATYDNGVSGACNISGNMPAYIINFFGHCGGTLSVVYPDVTDPCGRTISGQTFTIDVQPAPKPTITLPTLPASVSCVEAQTYVPPMASYDNGLTGVCNISGFVSGGANHLFDECGGTLEIVYHGTDPCGRNINAVVTTIVVNPAPAPTLTVPTLPTSFTCEEAQNFYAPHAPYDNGLSGNCNISGWLQGMMVKNIDACNGGIVTVYYSGQDGCGNDLTQAPIVIPVAPAPLPTIHLPEIPNPVYCWQASGFYPENATFSNGLSGDCENSGMLYPSVQHFWNTCDGGYILIRYDGVDNCGNPLSVPWFKTTVHPDDIAPIGECVNIEAVVNIEDAIASNNLQFYKDSIASHYWDYCSYVVVNVVGDTGEPTCRLNGTYERTYLMEVADGCGNVADTCSLTFLGRCDPLFCTLPQDFYGRKFNSDSLEYTTFGTYDTPRPDSLFGYSSFEILDSLMGYGEDSIFIGSGDCGFILDDAMCVQTILGGHGQSVSLSPDFTLDCSSPLNNVLVNQVITTILNIRYNNLFNPNGPLDYGNYQLSATCKGYPEYIIDSLPPNPTINDLLDYANDFIGCQCTGTCDDFNPVMYDLTCSLIALNLKFENCHVSGPCQVDYSIFKPLYSDTDSIDWTQPLVSGNNPTFSSFSLYPNPAKDFITLDISELVGTTASIEIFNVQGMKMYEKSYDAIPQPKLRIKTNDYPSGIYLMTVQPSGSESITKRFVIRK